jgi:hypothetical protein
MKLEHANNVFGHKIVEGSEYQWNCWPNARFMDYEAEHAYGSVVYSTSNGMIFEATVHFKEDDSVGPYRWLNPSWKDRMFQESKRRGVDHGAAWDDVRWVDLEVWHDFAEKAGAMFRGETPDSRIQVPVDLSDEEFMQLARRAHEADMTINKYVEMVLMEEIERHESESEVAPARAARDVIDEGDLFMENEDHDDYDNERTVDVALAELDAGLRLALGQTRALRDEFRELCLQQHQAKEDDRSPSEVESHSDYWYDTQRNR